MLTGTLVTAAGFPPAGMARATAGEYAGNVFWIVGLALAVSRVVAVFFTPYIGVKLLADFTGHGTGDHSPRHELSPVTVDQGLFTETMLAPPLRAKRSAGALARLLTS